MVVGVKFHSVITTSVSLEDRLDNRGDFYHQKSSFKGRHRQFSDQCGTLFHTNVRFYVAYFSGLKYPLIKQVTNATMCTV